MCLPLLNVLFCPQGRVSGLCFCLVLPMLLAFLCFYFNYFKLRVLSSYGCYCC